MNEEYLPKHIRETLFNQASIEKLWEYSFNQETYGTVITDYFQGDVRGSFMGNLLYEDKPYSSIEMLSLFRDMIVNDKMLLKDILYLIKEEGKLTEELTFEYAPYLLGGK